MVVEDVAAKLASYRALSSRQGLHGTCDPVPWRSFFDGLAAECDMAPAQISRDAYLLLGTLGARAKPLLGVHPFSVIYLQALSSFVMPTVV
jgi:hypothetical protein